MKLLLDTASLWYRAYFGMPDTLVSPEGMPVHLIRGVTDMVARLITKYDPTEIAVCLDSDWRPSWRVELIPEYKAHRVDADDEVVEESMSAQIPILLELFAAAGFPLIGVSNYEADDVIATLAHVSTQPVMVVTGDRDLFQLVDDRILIVACSASNFLHLDEQTVSPAPRFCQKKIRHSGQNAFALHLRSYSWISFASVWNAHKNQVRMEVAHSGN